MKKRITFDPIPVPGWAFVTVSVLYNEWLLHFWIMEELQMDRLAAITAFALAFGAGLGLITSFFSWRVSKKVAMGISLAVAVICVTEYFISDAYQVFMTPKTVISGAGGVAKDYFGLILSLVLRNLWRIVLMVLPAVLYGLCCRSRRPKWQYSAALAVAAVVCMVLGIQIVKDRTRDADKLRQAYNFDSAVRSFGLNMALSLEAVNSGGEDEAPTFVAVAPMPVYDGAETEPAAEPLTEPVPSETAAAETEPAETAAPAEMPAAPAETSAPTEPAPVETRPSKVKDSVSAGSPRETVPPETAAPTEAPTEPAETAAPTEAPTEPVETAAPTEAPTEPAETAAPTEAPTEPAEVPTEPSVPAETAAPKVPAARPKVTGETNVMAELDFAAMSQTEKNKQVAALHSYVASLTPTRKNEYTGLFAGKNLILITAEAFAEEVLDPQLTPTLYRLANNGIKFEDYYQPAWGASTTSGEFSNVVGLVPTTGGLCMKETTHQDLFLTMGHQLQDLGYYSAAYHNHNKDFYDRHKTHEKLGYDRFIAQYGGLEGVDPVWPESDLQMIQSTVDDYIDQQPFSVYYMTVSGHCVYSEHGNAQGRKHIDKVSHLPYSETVRYYMASQLELEYAMAELVAQLEAKGIADDTVIVMATDHYPYGLERSGTWKNTSDYLRELYGVESYDNFVRDHNALIIWSGCLEDKNIVVEEPVYSLDILPTLSNLFGVEYDSRLLVGRDVFSDAEPIVLWPDYSWKTDKGTFSIKTGEFIPEPGAQIPAGYVEYISSLVANKITYCDSVLKTDYFNFLSEALGR